MTGVPRRALLTGIALALLPVTAGFAAPVRGTAIDYPQPNGLVEQCIRIEPMPGARFDPVDREAEAAFCSLDFRQLAVCPKLWSTSPATILFKIDTAALDGEVVDWERARCADGERVHALQISEPGVFKQSVNGQKTSATYAPSSWVYYHFSRYLETQVAVPVAVYRSVDRDWHHRRVVQPGLEVSGRRRGLGMLNAGWQWLDELESGAADHGRSDVLTDEGRQVYGVLLNGSGRRYEAEFNGTRASGWGSGQNRDFQKTAPFLALRDPRPVTEAAEAAIVAARQDPLMARHLPADVPVAQVVLWMRDVLDVTLLDFILGQQDRIGNIDYRWAWTWRDGVQVNHRPAADQTPPTDLADLAPLRLRRTVLNDNDAGVRPGYANFAQRTGMLDDLRHYDPALYRRLAALATDFADNGPARQWLTGAAGISENAAQRIVDRTQTAWTTLRDACERGDLALDLVPAAVLPGRGAPVAKDAVTCRPDLN